MNKEQIKKMLEQSGMTPMEIAQFMAGMMINTGASQSQTSGGMSDIGSLLGPVAGGLLGPVAGGLLGPVGAVAMGALPFLGQFLDQQNQPSADDIFDQANKKISPIYNQAMAGVEKYTPDYLLLAQKAANASGQANTLASEQNYTGIGGGRQSAYKGLNSANTMMANIFPSYEELTQRGVQSYNQSRGDLTTGYMSTLPQLASLFAQIGTQKKPLTSLFGGITGGMGMLGKYMGNNKLLGV